MMGEKGGGIMYEEFGAVVDEKKVEFRLFFPDNTLDRLGL